MTVQANNQSIDNGEIDNYCLLLGCHIVIIDLYCSPADHRFGELTRIIIKNIEVLPYLE